jgi:uncharacterized membrane protein SpoIIM required for sporulation
MKNLITVFAISLILLLSSCGNSKVINVPVKADKTEIGAIMKSDSTYYVMKNIEFEPYGFFNKESKYNPMIRYDWVGGNLFLCIIFSESLIVPGYIIGFNWYEPVALKESNQNNNVIIINP